MTKLCIHCNAEKTCNDSDHILHFDDNFNFPFQKSVFKKPDVKGTSFFVKYVAIRQNTMNKKKIVIKWSRHKQLWTARYKFRNIRKRSNRTSRIIAAFKDSFDTLGWKFTVVKPTPVPDCRLIGISVEPYIKNITSFKEYVNSDICNAEVVNLLNALIHFSYKFSREHYIIRSLKIAVDEDSKSVVMLPPVLVSERAGNFGLEDNGTLRDFFRSEHDCNDICNGLLVPK